MPILDSVEFNPIILDFYKALFEVEEKDVHILID